MVKYATDITKQVVDQQMFAQAVEESQEITELVQTGDLTDRIALEGKTGSVGQICEGVNALVDKVTEILLQVREAGEPINTAASEISTGNNDLPAEQKNRHQVGKKLLRVWKSFLQPLC